MKTRKQKDSGEFVVQLHYEGHDNQIALVKAASRSKMDWFPYRSMIYKRHGNYREYYWCLWGALNKPLEECAPIECITPTGRPQGLGPALKLFNEMVRSAQTVTMS
jgi:hypothetical protein